TTAENQLAWSKDPGVVIFPATPESLDDPFFTEQDESDPLGKARLVAAEQVPMAAVNAASFLITGQIQTAILEAIQLAITGGSDPQEALSSAQETANSLLEKTRSGPMAAPTTTAVPAPPAPRAPATRRARRDRNAPVRSGAARRRRWSVPYLWAILPAAAAATFSVCPSFDTVILSFTDAAPLGGGGAFVGLENCRTVLTDPDFHRALINCLVYAVVTVPL